MSDANKYVWRLLEAKLSEKLWRSGDWLYGGDLVLPELGLHGHAVGAGRNVSEAGEWWAPCNADGSPRPWPDNGRQVATEMQTAPTRGSEDVVPMVIADLEARARVGESKYGTPLQTHNGRSAPLDLYQELLDAACYARQWIAEREDLQAKLQAVTDEREKMRAALQVVHELIAAMEGGE